ncbi:MAG: hypothetical protein ACFFDT_16930 [Candidatus Hodarchaeota archaeon]
MPMVTLSDHEHAYQPRRIIDGIKQIMRKKDIKKNIMGRVIQGNNYFEVVLLPHSVYDEIIKSARCRSVNIEPITLSALEKLNPPAYHQLVTLLRKGDCEILFSLYSHPIAPLMRQHSEFDVRINFIWSFKSLITKFGDFFHKTPSDRCFWGVWLSETAVDTPTLHILQDVAKKVYYSGPTTPKTKMELFIILDEFQVKNAKGTGIYRLEGTENSIHVILRDNMFSNVISFGRTADVFLDAFRAALSRGIDKVFVAADAENWGGNYDPYKPQEFQKFEEFLDTRGISIDESQIVVKRLPVPVSLREANAWKQSVNFPLIKLHENTAWSDYTDGSFFKNDWGEFIGRKTSHLCRWSGIVKAFRDEVYWLVYTENLPDNTRYTRIVSSHWKIAFNQLRYTVSNLTRKTLFDVLLNIGLSEDTIETTAMGILQDYWQVALADVDEDSFVSNSLKSLDIKYSSNQLSLLCKALRAYQYASQEAMISCPTYWSEFDNELTWTALALSAAGLILCAEVYEKINPIKTKELAELYRNLFLEFGHSSLTREFLKVDTPLEVLLGSLIIAARKAGFDLDSFMASLASPRWKEPDFLKLTEGVATTLFQAAVQMKANPIKPSDINQNLLAFFLAKNRTLRKEYFEQAVEFEIRKSLDLDNPAGNIIQQVGKLHQQYFPGQFF